ncbi:MAG TPA: DMT family transporter, partial [Bdellovibrionales bacterium]|nr:DMT family transporter [Bdellovibrionales bacterium]
MYKSKPITPRLAVMELVLAGAMWGFGFITTVWSLQGVGPLWAVTIRFTLVTVLAAPFVFRAKYAGMRGLDQLRIAFWPGMFLAINIILQTWGLKYTTATKSSFITVLYVLMVPFIERFVLGRRLPPGIVTFALTGLVGTAMICQFNPLSPQGGQWNIGDLMTLGCAVAGAGQIITIGIVSNKIQSSFVYNYYQAAWALILPLIVAPMFESFDLTTLDARAWFGLFYLALGSQLVAFMLQVRAQRVLSPTLASLLFLLESPFAAVFAFALLGEQLSYVQWLGAVVIMLSSLGA